MISYEATVRRWMPTASDAVRLNLGCGTKPRSGSINLDVAALDGVDLVTDFATGSLPLQDQSVSFIEAKDVLEHVHAPTLLREIHRLLCPGGIVVLQAVHFSSRNLFVDPTHTSAFSVRTFDFFAGTGPFSHRSYYFDFRFSQLESVLIQFRPSRYQPWNRILERLANHSCPAQDIYELTGLCRIFPAENVIAVLRK